MESVRTCRSRRSFRDEMAGAGVCAILRDVCREDELCLAHFKKALFSDALRAWEA